MYTNTGYLNYKDIDLEDLNSPLIVESSGVYRLVKRPHMTTIRSAGRRDYQLLYIASGKAYFSFDGNMQDIASGNMVLYRPHIPQHYVYYASDQTEVYWVHFTGSEVEALLEDAGFSDTNVIHTGISPSYQQLFLQLIRELQVRRPRFQELLSLTLRQILVLIRRHSEEDSHKNGRIQKEVEHAIHFFNENYSQSINIALYAQSLHMSTSWFIRSFRQSVGMPPMQYITSIRIAEAKRLLESTDYNITEIAAITGYENPLYFSRIFKKQTGASPAQYRKTL